MLFIEGRRERMEEKKRGGREGERKGGEGRD